MPLVARPRNDDYSATVDGDVVRGSVFVPGCMFLPGERVDLVLVLPGSKRPFPARGIVAAREHQGRTGCVISWRTTDDRAHQAIDDLLTKRRGVHRYGA